MSGAQHIDFKSLMVPVATELMGDPNAALSSKTELRWNGRGSFSVDLIKGVWSDHQDGTGGGVLDLLRAKKGLEKADALQYLVERRHIPAEALADGKPRIVKTYDYTDENGALIFQVVRFKPKDFRQRRPDAEKKDGWTWSTKGIRKVLYRLPQIIEAVAASRTIYVVEGEKAADALAAIGLPATCSPGGAGKWRAEYNATLAGADVVILADNDPQAIDANTGELLCHPDGRPKLPGQDHAADVAKHLTGVAARVRVVMLPGLPSKGDVVDYLAAGHSVDDLLAEVASQPAYTRAAPDAAETAAAPKQSKDAASVDSVIADFNSKYMLVSEEGKAVIFQPGFDPVLKRRKYDRLTTRDLQTLYMNRRVKVGENDKGEAIWKTASDVWLRHPARRQFIGGVEFNPGAPARPDVLNLWEGFAVKPKRGDWSLMRAHIHNIVCAGNAAHADYFLKWNARMVQRPAELAETAVVLKGCEGCGKGTVVNAVLHLTGGHGLRISDPKHLVGNFNAHLGSTIFLFADEAFFAGDRSHTGILKALITEKELSIEAKFANMRNQANYLHIMMSSNNDWVVPASIEARRFFVLNVLPDRIRDFAYFQAIRDQMERGGYEAMLYDLLHMDLAGFNVRDVPTTDGLREQRKLSLTTTPLWWLDCLQRGYIYKSKIGLEATFAAWMTTASMELLHASYLEYAKAHGERRPDDREALGKFFAKMKTRVVRPRSAVIMGEAMRDEATAFGGTTRKAVVVTSGNVRPRCYILGDLGNARTAFEKMTTTRPDWEGAEADDAGGETPPETAMERASPCVSGDLDNKASDAEAGPEWAPYDDQ